VIEVPFQALFRWHRNLDTPKPIGGM